MNSEGTYQQKINTDHPGLIVILLDQSSSMSDTVPHETGSRTKSEIAADAVNRLIYAIVRRSSRGGTGVVKRCYVGVIGYGAITGPMVGGWTTELNDMGGLQSDSHGLKRYVQAVHKGSTPMFDAFAKALPLAQDWIAEHEDSFPPIVINITDGEPDDMQVAPKDGSRTRGAAEKVAQLGTRDGKLLLFNIHIGSRNATELILPTQSQIQSLNDDYAAFLFSISSEIPETMRRSALDAGFTPGETARGMAFNAADKLVQFLDWGSSGALR